MARRFSFLPDLTDAQILAQIRYALGNGWFLHLQFTDDPRNTYWQQWGVPLFDPGDPDGILAEVNACREALPDRYIRLTAFDKQRGWETPRMSLFVNQPAGDDAPEAR